MEISCPDNLLALARSAGPLRTAVIGADSAVVLDSVRAAVAEGLIAPVLVGDAARIAALAGAAGWGIAGVEICPTGSEEETAATAAAMAGRGEVAALMKGHVHTDTMMAAVLAPEAGLRTGRRMSHAFHISLPAAGRQIIVTDCALNIAPDARTHQAILSNAVDLARALGIDRPRAAILSATETPTPRIPGSIAARELADWAAEALPQADVAGPLALDNAISPEAAAIKGIDHPAAGHADIVVVPNLETGNALFKSMVYFASACAGGLVLGAKVPIMLTSRADPPAARLASAALAAIMVQHGERQ